MKILLVLIAVALAGVLAVSATLGAGTLVPGGSDKKKAAPMGAAPSGKAQLTPSSLSPPSLRGSGFRPGENVTVRMREGANKGTKRVRANASGSFVVRYPALPAGDCGGMNVTAVGDKGSRAGVQFSQFACAAPGVGS